MDQQPTPPQAPLPPAANQPAAAGAHYNMPQTNPGQTIGIIGLIFAFVGLAPIGLVLSIISTVKSSSASSSKSLGIVGIILNALGIVLLGFFFFVIVLSAYSGIQYRAEDSATQSNATIVAKHAEAYYAQSGNYPQTIADFERYETSRIDEPINVIAQGPTTTSEVQYKACGITGAKVAYLKTSSTVPVVMFIGSGSSTTC